MRQRFVRRHLSPSPWAGTTAPTPRVLTSPFHVEHQVASDGYLVLRLVGELESATVPIFRQAIADIGTPQELIVDMSRVPFLDSCGIGALIGAVRRVRELGGTVTIASVCAPVRRVLGLTGVDRIVELAETVEEAGALMGRRGTGSSSDRDAIAI